MKLWYVNTDAPFTVYTSSTSSVESSIICTYSTNGKHTYKVLEGKPEENKWVNTSKMDLYGIWWNGVVWIHVTRDRDYWRAPVSKVINLRIPRISGNFQTSWESISFWTKRFSPRNYSHKSLNGVCRVRNLVEILYKSFYYELSRNCDFQAHCCTIMHGLHQTVNGLFHKSRLSRFTYCQNSIWKNSTKSCVVISILGRNDSQ
jgi:hypothetical protein